VPAETDWFEVYRVRPGVFAIYEPRQYEEVISYLILGSQRALLFDTGMGISDISKVVAQLTTLPVSVLNSHTHFDHIGGNWHFQNVLGMDTAYTQKHAAGATHEELQEAVIPERICGKLPSGFDAHQYAIPGFKVNRHVKNGSVIDLGGRRLEVLATPGHTPDAVSLLDRQNKLLFTGDTFYAGTIFLYVPETDLTAYRQSIRNLQTLVPRLELVLPGHNFPAEKPEMLDRLVKAFDRARAGKAKFVEDDGRREYLFDGFSILLAR
jgi:glyoxylase-like metal-dependent hydrolase (beta-lactamase superfamily II)